MADEDFGPALARLSAVGLLPALFILKILYTQGWLGLATPAVRAHS